MMHTLFTAFLVSSLLSGILCAPPPIDSPAVASTKAFALNGSAPSDDIEYKVPNSNPPVTLSIGTPREDPRRTTDVFVVLIEALAKLAERKPTETFPEGIQEYDYQGIALSIYRVPGTKPRYNTIVAATRGLGEYMSISQTFGKRDCRVYVGGKQVAILFLQNQYGTDIPIVGTTGVATSDRATAKV
ncbi:MAG: hypothetical protein Q9164_001023 [Protoblastenia rupestris]